MDFGRRVLDRLDVSTCVPPLCYVSNTIGQKNGGEEEEEIRLSRTVCALVIVYNIELVL